MPPLPLLRSLRERKLMSQIDLSQRSGVAQATISNIEQGRPARFVTIRKLARVLGVKPTDLSGDARPSRRSRPSPEALHSEPAPSPLDVSLDRVHALAEAAWARQKGELAEAARWEQIAAGNAQSAEAER